MSIKRAAKTIILHSCDVENCEDTSATIVERGEIQRKGRTYCLAEAPNDVSFKNKILLREQCETSADSGINTSSKRPSILLSQISENPSHEPSILPALKKLKVATVAMSL